MKKRLISVALVALGGSLALYYYAFASTSPKSETPASRNAARANGPNAQGSRNSAARGPAVSVVTAPVTTAAFPVRRRTIGVVESAAVVTLRARLDSQVLTQQFTDGQMVKQGDLLFTLDDREVQAIVARDLATIEKDKAAAARAEADLKRTQELATRNVASRQTLDQADADHKAAMATLSADQAALELDRAKLSYTKISAPISGRTGAVSVTAGNLVSASATAGLVTITQITPIRVSFTLPERDLADLRAAADRPAKAAVRVYHSGETTPRATGELNFIDSSVDATSGTILAKAGFANTDLGLWPGQYVDVEVDLNVLPDTVTVPTVAIQTGQKGAYVFVAKPDQTVEMRPVTTASNDGDRTAITSGVTSGERVVVEGQVRLADGARVTDSNRERSSQAPKEGAPKESGPREAALPPRDAPQAQ